MSKRMLMRLKKHKSHEKIFNIIDNRIKFGFY